MSLSRSEKILLGVGIFFIAGTALFLFLDNFQDEHKNKTTANKKKGNPASSSFISVKWTAEKLAEKSRLMAMKQGLIRTLMSNQEIQKRLEELEHE